MSTNSKDIKAGLCDAVCAHMDEYLAVTDEDRRIIEANKRVSDFYGDVIGKRCNEVFGCQMQDSHNCPIVSGERSIYITKSGKWFEERVARITVDGRNLYAHFVKDITEMKKAEEEIKSVRDNFKNLVELCPDVIVVHDGKKILFANPAVEKVIGMKPEEIVGKPIFEFIHPEYWDVVRERMNRALKGEMLPLIEEKIALPGGRELIVEVTGGPVTWDGKPAVALLIRDITERKKLEKRYYDLWNSLSDGLLIVAPDGKILEVNKRVEEISGRSREELVGRNIAEFLSSRYAKMAMDAIKKLISTAESRRVELPVESRGKTIWVEARGRLAEYDGRQVVQVSLRDITERRELEKRLRDERELMNRIVESANALVVGLDKEGRIVLFNKKCEEVTGWRREEVIGTEWVEVFVPEDYRNEFIEALKRAIKEKVEFTSRIRTREGGLRTISWSATSVRVGKRELVICTGVDVSDEISYMKKVEEYAELLKLVNKIMRHDLLNSLTVIECALEVYRETGEEKMLDKIAATVTKSIGLIKNMQRFEAIVSGRDNLKPVKVRSVVEKIVAEYPEVEFDIIGDCTVLADEALQSVIDNIVRNAVVHGKTKKITIVMRSLNGRSEVEITDYGVGIPERIRERIFEEGFSGSNSTGLGLYIVRKVMERYGGNVRVESNDKGTTFILEFRSA